MGGFADADVMGYVKLPPKYNFHFRNIHHMKFYPGLMTGENDISQEYHIKLRSVHILADFVDIENKAVCACLYIFICTY